MHARITDSVDRYGAVYEFSITKETFQCQWVKPLHKAAGHGHAGVTKLLLDHGADILARGRQGYTPLFVAVHGGQAEAARVLQEYGAPTKDGDETDNATNLYWAASEGYEDVVRLLLEYGAASEADTDEGRQLLAMVIDRRHLRIVELLKSYGFKTTEED